MPPAHISHIAPCEAWGFGAPHPSWKRGLASLDSFLSFLHGIPGKWLAKHPVLLLR